MKTVLGPNCHLLIVDRHIQGVLIGTPQQAAEYGRQIKREQPECAVQISEVATLLLPTTVAALPPRQQ